MTITATHDQVRDADHAELVMLSFWRSQLEVGAHPDVVVGMIAAAVDFEPLLGLTMDVCNLPACHTWVDEAERDEHGDLYCSDGCRDEASHAAEERRYAEARRRLADDGRWAS